MKRIFVMISNLLASLFFIWVFSIWDDTYVSYYYPNIAAFVSSPKTTFDSVSERLTQLAEETDSLIAIQHQEPGEDGTPIFSYTTFGRGKLPNGLSEKSLKDARTTSVKTNYFIFDGNLDVDYLRQELSRLGLSNLYMSKPSNLTVLTSVFSNGFQAIGLLIFFLTFGALSLISQIRVLRTAGIRLISGDNRWLIFLRPLGQDVGNALFGVGSSIVFMLILKQFIPFPLIALSTIVTGLVVYNILLLAISLFFASIFAIGIKKVHLMQVIKGQIPVRGIISLILIGQLLAVIIVAIGVSRTFTYSQAWQQQEQGRNAWQKESNLTVLSSGREGVDLRQDRKEVIRKQKIWFDLINQAVSEEKAFLAYHHLVDRVMKNGIGSSKNLMTSTVWQDYSPEGNVLIVTPQYLKRQQVKVKPEIDAKINQLISGEFILLLPEKLHSEENHYKAIFEEDLTNRVSSEDTRQNMVATVSYLETGHDRFVYNTTPISYQQFLRDPIIVVLTPQSTGEQAFLFWEQVAQNYLFFDHLSVAQDLIHTYGIENWVSELQLGHQIHQTLLDNLQREMWTMVAGAMLGIMTSVLMFNTMNCLYFEEFRRNIFIKRIAGLRFLEIHRNYLLSQLFVFFLGFLVSVFLVTNVLIAFLVLLLFIVLSIFQLYFQMKKENQMSMLILKGA